MPNLFINLVLFAVLALACVTDLRSRRIPNALTFGTVALGLALNGVLFGFDGLRESAQGTGIGLALLMPLFMLRWMGAGDVKADSLAAPRSCPDAPVLLRSFAEHRR